jgi:hypothetical protein
MSLIDLCGYFPYLKPHECDLHLKHAIKDPRISINTYAEYPMLYNNILSVKPCNGPTLSCKDHLDFSHKPDPNHMKDR